MIYLVVWVACGLCGALIAQARGASGCAWFAAGFFLGPLALLFALLDTGRQCPACRKKIHVEATRCPHCTAEVGPPPRPQPSAALTPEAEERARVTAAQDSKLGRIIVTWAIIIPLLVCALLFITVLLGGFSESTKTVRTNAGSESIHTFTGTVMEHGTATVSGLPYLRITEQTLSVKCYTSERRPLLAKVTVRGTVTMWVDGAGGALRPCTIID